MANASSPALGFRVAEGRLWSGRPRPLMSQASPWDLDLLDDLLQVEVRRSDELSEGREDE